MSAAYSLQVEADGAGLTASEVEADLEALGLDIDLVSAGSDLRLIVRVGDESSLARAEADVCAVCLATTDVDQIVATVEVVAPSFGAIGLEDIAAPRCFEIEARLRESLDIEARARSITPAMERAAAGALAELGRADRSLPAVLDPDVVPAVAAAVVAASLGSPCEGV